MGFIKDENGTYHNINNIKRFFTFDNEIIAVYEELDDIFEVIIKEYESEEVAERVLNSLIGKVNEVDYDSSL